MKQCIIAILIAGSFLSCGSGGGTTGPSLAEATTQNALKAYDAMSVATYLPSLYVNLYSQLNNGGVDAEYYCSNDGSINVKFIDMPNAEQDDGTPLFLYPGSYEFHNCILDIDGIDVILDGKIISYSNSLETVGDSISGYIKSGFKFEIKNDVSLIYGAFPFKESSKIIVDYFNDDGRGSYFTVVYTNSGAKFITNHSKYKEATLGDITFAGSFVNTLLMTGISKDQKGIFISSVSDDMINWLIPLDSSDYWDKLLIYINPNEYFETDYDKVDVDTVKAILMGKNDKNVTVWQDENEVVYAETENRAEHSSEIHTPSF